MRKHPFAIGSVGGILGTPPVAVAVWPTIVDTGACSVAASNQHADAVRWTLDPTMRRSVASRAGGVQVPEGLSEDMIAEGAQT